MAERFNWLHLTDLHIGHPDYEGLWPNIKNAFHNDLKTVHEKCGPFDAVFFTGDLAMSGLSDQYDKLENKFLPELWESLQKLGSLHPVLLAVPGNHDLARPSVDACVEVLLDKKKFSRLEKEKFWAKPDSEYREKVKNCFEAYSQWWRKTKYTDRKNIQIKDGILPGDFSTTIKVGTREIGIVGLNTTFLQLTAGDFKGKLSLHWQQLLSMCGDYSDYEKRHDALLLLTHQGFDWLSKNAQERYREINHGGRFAAHLFGHMHETNLLDLEYGGGETQRRWQARSLCGIENVDYPKKTKRSHGYSAGSITFDNDEITIRCWPRKANLVGFEWTMDGDSERAKLIEDGGIQPKKVKLIRRVETQRPKLHDTLSADQPLDLVARPLNPSRPDTAENELPVYVGLKPYGPENSHLFFGREKEIQELIGLISPSVQTLHIRGGSGVGKSSLVYAGLLPRLGKTNGSMAWDSLAFKPDLNPFLSLARELNERNQGIDFLPDDASIKNWAEQMEQSDEYFIKSLTSRVTLGSEAARRVLYIDQLEELLLHSRDDDEKQRERRHKFAEYLSRYLKADPRNLLITSIRTDRDDLRDLPQWNALRTLINQGRQYTVVVPDDVEGISEIVWGPARLANFDIEPALITALRTDVKGLINWTPLLSAALQDTVECYKRSTARPVRRLTLKLYEATGGLGAIIERRAKTVTELLPEVERNEVLPRIFSLLVRLDEEGRATRRRYTGFTDLTPTEQGLLDKLIKGRLLVAEGGIEFFHDVLFRRWKDLNKWIEAKKEDIDELSDIEHQAKRWKWRGRREIDLLGKDRIDRSEGALERHPLRAKELPILEDFVKCSRKLRDQEALVEAIRSGKILDIDRLIRRKVELSEDQIANLAEKNVFYYSLFPERITRRPAIEGIESTAILVAEGFREVSEMSASTSPTQFNFFNKSNIRGHVSSNFTVQHFAALAGHVDLLAHFEVLGADMFAPSDDGNDPLTTAAFGGRLNALKWLATRSKSPKNVLTQVRGKRKIRRSPIHWAAQMGHNEVVEYLIEQSADVNEIDKNGFSVLDTTACFGNPAVLKTLLKNGANLSRIGPEGQTPLQLAIAAEKWDNVRSLLENAPAEQLQVNNTSEHGWTALGKVVDGEVIDLDIIRRLLAAGTCLDQGSGEKRAPPVVLATTRGHKSLVDLLIERQANVNLPDSSGRTALHHAVTEGHLEILKSLLADHAIEVDALDSKEMTPLFYAARAGEEEMVNALLGKGAQANRHFPGEVFILEGAVQGADDETRVIRGRIAQRLFTEGAPMPAWQQFAYDESGRVIGLQSIPEHELYEWFLNRLVAITDKSDWRIPPLIEDSWLVLDKIASARILARFAGTSNDQARRLKTVTIAGTRTLPLSIYPGGHLYEVSVHRSDGVQGYLTFLETAGRFVSIDGKSAQIHELNKEQNLLLHTAPDVAIYLSFFCSSISGEEGTFRIFEQEQHLLPQGKLLGQTEEDARRHAASPKIVSEAEDENGLFFICSAPVKYSSFIFEGEFKIYRNGSVEMLNDKAVVENLDVYSEIFIDGIRALGIPSKRMDNMG